MPHKCVSELSAMSAMFSGMTYFEFFALNSDGNGMQHGVSWRRWCDGYSMWPRV